MTGTDWRIVPKNATTTDGICEGIKWPALIFTSYQQANEWLIDVEHLRRLKPTMDVEDCVVFYFGRTSMSSTDTTQVALLPEKVIDATEWSVKDAFSTDPLYVHAVKLASQYAAAPTKLKACEIVFNSSMEHSTEMEDHRLVSPGVEVDDEREWNLLFESIWDVLEADGWSLLMVSGELCYVMPGVDFLMFQPNVNVFSSKKLAFKKALAVFADTQEETPSSIRVWGVLWDYMETHKQWKALKLRNDTVMYHIPGARVMDLVQNQTLFHNKKDAVLKFTTESKNGVKKRKSPVGVEDAPLVSPSSPHLDPPAPTSAEPEVEPIEPVEEDNDDDSPILVRPKKVKKRALPKPVAVEPAETHSYHSSRRCFIKSTFPFARIYAVLRDIGWSFAPGDFGYDYFPPGKTLSNGVAGVDYFQTEEAVLEYLQGKGWLSPLEKYLRTGAVPSFLAGVLSAPGKGSQSESASSVPSSAEEVVPAKSTSSKNHSKSSKPTKQRLSFSGVDATPDVKAVQPRKQKDKKSAAAKKRELVAVSPPSRQSGFKCTFGLVYRFLRAENWNHVVGPVGFTYCMPGFNLKNGTVGVNIFHNEADLETFLKESGDWDRIAFRLERAYMGLSDESSPESSAVKSYAKDGGAIDLLSPEQAYVGDDENMSAESSPEKKVLPLSRLKQGKTKKPKAKQPAQPAVSVPPFVLKFGRLFDLLKASGWYYRSSRLGYEYAQKDKSGKILHSFVTEDEVVDHLKKTGEYAALEQRLRKDHRRKFIIESSTEATSASEAVRIESSEDEKVSSPLQAKYTFANIWPILKERGWTERKPNTMEDSAYTYCNPEGTTYNKRGVETYASIIKLLDEEQHSSESSSSEDSSSDEEEEIVNKSTAKVLADTQVTEATQVTQEDDDDATQAVVDLLSSSDEEGRESKKPKARKIILTEEEEEKPKEATKDAPPAAMLEIPQSEEVATQVLSPPKQPRSSFFAPSPPKSQLVEQELSRVLDNLSLSFKPESMPHRASQQRTIKSFIDNCVNQNQRGSAYISGTPGTGKTAMMRIMQEQVTREWRNQQTALHIINLNAMALCDSHGIFTTIASKVTNKSYSSFNDAIAALDSAFKSNQTTTLLILDEIDILINNKGEADLYRLFEWAHHPDSSLIFFGIANSIDLTNKYIPFLRTRACVPVVVMFRPYEYEAIHNILEARIAHNTLLTKPLFEPVAISFLARKIASSTGDIRVAFDVCRRILHQKSEKEGTSKPWTVTLMDITSMLKVLDFQGAKVLQTLPRSTQFIVYTTTKMTPKVPNVFVIDEVYDKFCELSRLAGTSPSQIMTLREFHTQLETLASQNLLAMNSKKESFRLFMTKEEHEKSLIVDPYFKALLRQ
ncbi:hypothetical protein THRCLA_00954 [Thraustotheca clavata]|uniref:Uncharacterized protein n=1 Tax=Thraustotheca clavata TaxID=74557 RepID=A0A1W0A9R9_9STRA|nr:hypothetical protein THRCLA_00954 [Thraustotheca clavata]